MSNPKNEAVVLPGRPNALHAAALAVLIGLVGCLPIIALASGDGEKQPPSDTPAVPMPVEDKPSAPAQDVPGADAAKEPSVAPALHEPSEADLAGKKIFEDAARVLRDAQSISYTATIDGGTGMIAMAYPPSEVRVTARRAPEGKGVKGWIVLATGVSHPGKDKPDLTIDMAWLENGQVEYLDHAKKAVVEKQARGFNAPGLSIANLARLADVLQEAPFEPQLRAETFTIEPSQEIDGQTCDVVLISSRGGKQKHRWAISPTDHFPRRTEQLMESATMKESIKTTLTNVVVSDAQPSSTDQPSLRVIVPEGYTQERAPVPSPASAPPEGTKAKRSEEMLKLRSTAAIADEADQEKSKLTAEDGGKNAAVTKVLTRTQKTQEIPDKSAAASSSAQSLGDAKQLLDGNTGDVARSDPIHRASSPSTPSTPAGSRETIAADSHAAVPLYPRAAPSFDLARASGDGTVSLANLRGKVVVITFTGTWCVSCPDWHKSLDSALTTEFAAVPESKGRVRVLALAFRERDPGGAAGVLASLSDDARKNVTLLLGADRAFRDFGAHVPGATFVVNSAGMIVAGNEGTLTEDAAKSIAGAAVAAE